MAISDHLALTEDERALQRTLRDFLTAHLASAELRPLLDSDPGYSPALHERLIRELGLGGLTTPEQFGGLGLGQAEACVVHQELGRALYPGPFLASCLVASVLSAAGDPATCQRWLPLLADGTVTGTVAAAGQSGRWPPGPDSVRARQAGLGVAGQQVVRHRRARRGHFRGAGPDHRRAGDVPGGSRIPGRGGGTHD